MQGTGTGTIFLIIKGVWDYADDHKDSVCHLYNAANSAADVKSLFEYVDLADYMVKLIAMVC